MAEPKTVLNINPRLFTSLLTGLGLAAVDVATSLINPHAFDGLGAYAAPAQVGVTVGLSVFSGWLRRLDATDGNGKSADVAKQAESVYTDVKAEVAAPTPAIDFDKLVGGVEATVKAAEPTAAPAAPAASPFSLSGSTIV